jgi:hypothetical protein
MPQNGFSPYSNHRLGDHTSFFAQSRAETAGEYHYFHHNQYAEQFPTIYSEDCIPGQELPAAWFSRQIIFV